MKYLSGINEHFENKEKRPKVVDSSYKFWIDNPEGYWLKETREKALNRKYGISTPTAGFHKKIEVPMIYLNLFLEGGLENEQEKYDLNTPKVIELAEKIKNNVFDLKEHSPFLIINQEGDAYLSEGNRRYLAAKRLDMNYIPLEVNYRTSKEGSAS